MEVTAPLWTWNIEFRRINLMRRRRGIAVAAEGGGARLAVVKSEGGYVDQVLDRTMESHPGW
jgi:hypothetical protein